MAQSSVRVCFCICSFSGPLGSKFRLRFLHNNVEVALSQRVRPSRGILLHKKKRLTHEKDGFCDNLLSPSGTQSEYSAEIVEIFKYELQLPSCLKMNTYQFILEIVPSQPKLIQQSRPKVSLERQRPINKDQQVSQSKQELAFAEFIFNIKAPGFGIRKPFQFTIDQCHSHKSISLKGVLRIDLLAAYEAQKVVKKRKQQVHQYRGKQHGKSTILAWTFESLLRLKSEVEFLSRAGNLGRSTPFKELSINSQSTKIHVTSQYDMPLMEAQLKVLEQRVQMLLLASPKAYFEYVKKLSKHAQTQVLKLQDVKKEGMLLRLQRHDKKLCKTVSYFPGEPQNYTNSGGCLIDLKQNIRTENIIQGHKKQKLLEIAPKRHLIVLVHGLNGNSVDLRNIKRTFQKKLCISSSKMLDQKENERIDFYFSVVNQMHTTWLSISQQGINLAKQLQAYLQSHKGQGIHRISFVAHSLGGLIVRAALPYLYKYAYIMEKYVTLSTPHLGYLGAGQMRTLAIKLFLGFNTLPIRQLLFEDSEHFEDCFLFRLANAQGLNWFRKLIFCSSPDDKYIPLYSASLDPQETQKQSIDERGLSRGTKRDSVPQMVRDLLKGLNACEIVRLQVRFGVADVSLDSLIGRTAHLKFLNDEQFLQQLKRVVLQ